MSKVIAIGIASVGLTLGSMLILLATWWDGPLSAETPEAWLSIGPFEPGGSVQQQFRPTARYLSGLEFAVHAGDSENPRANLDLQFRIYDAQRIVREGTLTIPDLAGDLRFVRWDFPPLTQIHPDGLSLQIVFHNIRGSPVFIMASLGNPLPGALSTNGIPTAEHIDLTLSQHRRIQRTQIAGAIVSAAPGGWGVVPAAMALAIVFSVAGIDRLGRSHGVPTAARLGLALAGPAALVFGLTLLVRSQANEVVPEIQTEFWQGFWIVILAAATALLRLAHDSQASFCASPALRVATIAIRDGIHTDDPVGGHTFRHGPRPPSWRNPWP